ncbi:MAG TPA: hypothetical protein VFF63_00750 [Candidatus Babeliales bacterium]|nr:hypothetical protein [Candidatus Babeliales bacterium]
MRIVLAAALIVLAWLAHAQAGTEQIVAGRNITFTGTVPMTAFLRWERGPDGTIAVDEWEVRNGRVVAAYDVDMTKLMHLIVVSDDLTDFQHVHPTLLPNGHFSIQLHAAHPEQAYHIYMDGIPSGAGRHVFRFDLPAQDGGNVTRQLHPAGSSVNVGPYTVAIDPTSIPFGEIATISVRILKDGRPATDLHPYLGAMAHGVLIGVNDLAYMHAHGMTDQMLAMAAGASDCGDSMMLAMPPMPPNLTIGNEFEFEILAPSAQDYDFWIQFVGGKTLYTAPLLVTTK